MYAEREGESLWFANQRGYVHKGGFLSRRGRGFAGTAIVIVHHCRIIHMPNQSVRDQVANVAVIVMRQAVEYLEPI